MKKILPAQSRKMLPSLITLSISQPVFIPLFFADPTQKRQIVWQLELQNGERISGKAKKNKISLSKLNVGEHKLSVIVGIPFIFKKHKIYQCILKITA